MPTGDLRTTVRIRRTAGALLLCAALAACDTGTATPGGSAPASATATTPPSRPSDAGTPSTAATTGAPAIPAGALLQKSDVRSGEPAPLEEGEYAYVRPLRPCGNDPYPSDGSRKDAVAMRYVLEPANAGETPSVALEFAGLHAPGGAAEQFDDVSKALDRCPGDLAEGHRKWTVLDNGIAGDESVLVRIDQKFSYADEQAQTVPHYAALARVGDVIVVVTDLGWENTGGSESLVRDLIGKAVQRAGTIG